MLASFYFTSGLGVTLPLLKVPSQAGCVYYLHRFYCQPILLIYFELINLGSITFKYIQRIQLNVNFLNIC